jgi:hypothetical protein
LIYLYHIDLFGAIPVPNASLTRIEANAALYSPATGFNLSAIMTRAIAAARELREWQARFAASPNGIKSGFKPQSWRFLMSHALCNAWTAARAERAQHAFKAMSDSDKQLLAALSTDCRLAA